MGYAKFQISISQIPNKSQCSNIKNLIGMLSRFQNLTYLTLLDFEFASWPTCTLFFMRSHILLHLFEYFLRRDRRETRSLLTILVPARAARQFLPHDSVCIGPYGAFTFGSVGPKIATTGTPEKAARCITPVSPPTYMSARLSTAHSWATPRLAGSTTPAPAISRSCLASSSSPGPHKISTVAGIDSFMRFSSSAYLARSHRLNALPLLQKGKSAMMGGRMPCSASRSFTYAFGVRRGNKLHLRARCHQCRGGGRAACSVSTL